MKRLLLAVLCMAGLSSVAHAESIRCVDKQHKEHIVKFAEDVIEFTVVDDELYVLLDVHEASGIVKYKNDKNMIIFKVDKEKPDWFYITKTELQKNKKAVEIYTALCDNVNLIDEPQAPQLIKY